MSRYLIDRIQALPNVELHVGKEIVALEGDRDGLTAAVFRHRGSGATYTCPLRHLFLFIGADPNAAWLQDRVAVDAKGFVVTGFACPDGASAAGRARPAARDELPRGVRDRRRPRGLDQARRGGGRRRRRRRGADPHGARASVRAHRIR